MPRARMVFRRFRKRSGSIPAEEQTALKSWLSLKRNCSALRLKLSGPHIHSSKVFVITARQSLSSAVPRSLMCNAELLNMILAPRSNFVAVSALVCAAEGPQTVPGRKEAPRRLRYSGHRIGNIRNARLGSAPYLASLGTNIRVDKFWRSKIPADPAQHGAKSGNFLRARWRFYKNVTRPAHRT